jgi:hypothetical protein
MSLLLVTVWRTTALVSGIDMKTACGERLVNIISSAPALYTLSTGSPRALVPGFDTTWSKLNSVYSSQQNECKILCADRVFMHGFSHNHTPKWRSHVKTEFHITEAIPNLFGFWEFLSFLSHAEMT